MVDLVPGRCLTLRTLRPHAAPNARDLQLLKEILEGK
jgi:hypothetical protein